MIDDDDDEDDDNEEDVNDDNDDEYGGGGWWSLTERYKLINWKWIYFPDTDRPDTLQEPKVASKCAEGGWFPQDAIRFFLQDRDICWHRTEIMLSTGRKYFLPYSRNILFHGKSFLPKQQNIFIQRTEIYSSNDENFFHRSEIFHRTKIHSSTGGKYFLPLSLFSQYIGAFTPTCFRWAAMFSPHF